MAQLAIGLAGAGIGFFLGGPAGAAIGWSLGAGVGGYLFAPSGPDIEGPRLSDLRAQSSTYGSPIPEVLGTDRVAGIVLWMPKLIEVKETDEVGGKGGGGGQEVTSYAYFANAAIGIARGEVGAIGRVWADGKVIYDAREENDGPTTAAGYAGIGGAGSITKGSSAARLYYGTEGQEPDPLIEAAVGVGNTPGYLDWCYLVLERFPLKDYGNRLPSFTFEVMTGGVTYPSETYSHPSGRDNDARMYACPGYLYDATTDTIIAAAYNYDDLPTYADVTGFAPDGTQKWTNRAGNGANASENFDITAYDGLIYFRLGTGGNNCYVYDASTGSQIAQHAGTGYFGTSGFAYCPADGATWAYTPSGTNRIVRRNAMDGTLLSSITIDGGDGYGVSQMLWVPATARMWCWCTNGTIEVRTASGALDVYITSGLTPASACAMVLDTVTGSVWLSNGSNSKRINWTTHAVSATVPTPSCRQLAIDPTGARALYVYAGELRAIDLATLDEVVLSSEFSSNGVWHVYCPANRSLWCAAGTGVSSVRRILINRVGADGVSLADCVARVCERVGLAEGDIEVEELEPVSVQGFTMSRRAPGRSYLDLLRAGYGFDAVESGGLLKFVLRGKAAVASIAWDAQGAAEPGQTGARQQITRAEELRLPAVVEVGYRDALASYNVSIQRATREQVETVEQQAIELPVVMSAGQAKAAADRLLFEAWMARTARMVPLDASYLRLEPGDAIELLDAQGSARRVLIARTDIGRPGLVRLECFEDELSLATASAGGVEWDFDEVGIIALSPAVLYLLDLPMLRDADNDAGIYWAVTGTAEEWPGAAVYRGNDGENYAPIGSAPLTPAGTASTVLAAGDPTTWDDVNSVTVALLAGTLSSSTDLAVCNGANAAVLGNEIIQFVNVEDHGDGTYTLSRLLRGRRGTDHEMSAHAAGERFVLLQGTVKRASLNVSEIGATRYYKAATFGTPLDAASAQTFAGEGVALKPFSPVHVTAERDGSGNIALAWVRRSRIGTGWGAALPLGEVSEAYEIDILDGAEVVRTIAASTPSATYTDAQQIADFGGLVAEGDLDIIVYQLSAVVGRGFGRAASV